MNNPFWRSRLLCTRALFGALLVLLLPCAAAAPSDQAATLELIASDPGAGAVEEVGFDEVDLIFLSVPGYFLLQAALTFWTRRGWRIASSTARLVISWNTTRRTSIPLIALRSLSAASRCQEIASPSRSGSVAR